MKIDIDKCCRIIEIYEDLILMNFVDFFIYKFIIIYINNEF